MGSKLKTSPKGRRCKFPKCDCLLSIYNHSDYCHIHQEQESWKQARKAPYYHRA